MSAEPSTITYESEFILGGLKLFKGGLKPPKKGLGTPSSSIPVQSEAYISVLSQAVRVVCSYQKAMLKKVKYHHKVVTVRKLRGVAL